MQFTNHNLKFAKILAFFFNLFYLIFIKDAVTFLKNDHRYQCYGFGGFGLGGPAGTGLTESLKQSASLVGGHDSCANMGESLLPGAVMNDVVSPLENDKGDDPTTKTNTIQEQANADGGYNSRTSPILSPVSLLLLNDRKRSETYNQTDQLPSIPEVPAHSEKSVLRGLINIIKTDNKEAEIKEIREKNYKKALEDAIQITSISTPQQLRQRHRAGQMDRIVSSEDLILIQNVGLKIYYIN